MRFILEPVLRRYAIAIPAKVACASIRMWVWGMSGLPRTRECIFQEFEPYTLRGNAEFPDSVEAVIAVHRDGVSRMRAVYDHRIKIEREAADMGIVHFARHVPDYCALSESIAHHCEPQCNWLGSDPARYTDIIPLDRLELIREIIGEIVGKEPPPLPHVHKTETKTEMSDEVRGWFEKWTAYDTALGWDGNTMRLFPNGISKL